MKKTVSAGWSWPLFFLMAAGTILSVFAYLFVAEGEKAQAQTRFREIAEQRISAIEVGIVEATDMVSLLASYLGVAHPVSRANFSAFVLPTVANTPYVQALEWIPRVAESDRETLETQVIADGLAHFRIVERNPEGALVPALRRQQYFPVTYVEPLAGNERALGFDLASNPARREALERAHATGKSVATARITLVQERKDQYGVLVFAPAYRGGSTILGEARNSRFLGFALGVFRIEDIVARGLGVGGVSNADQLTQVHLFDLSAPEDQRQLYPKLAAPEAPRSLNSKFSASRNFIVGEREWQLIVTPGPGMTSAQRPIFAPIVLIAGLVFTALGGVLIKNNLNRTAEASAWARESEASRSRLTEAQTFARIINLVFNTQTGQLHFDARVATLLGLPPVGVAMPDFLTHVPMEERDYVATALGEPVRGMGELSVEFRFVGPDGQELVLHVLGQQAESDGVNKLISLQDITGRRAAEKERAQLMERMGEANKFESLGTLAGGIAHEINTPTQYVGDNLRFLHGSVTTLLDVAETVHEALSDKGKIFTLEQKLDQADLPFLKAELPSAIQQSIDGMERIGQIVQAIKEFSYPSGKLPAPFDLNRAVRMAATVTRNQWKYVAELHYELDETLPLITAIEGEVNQMLINLIVNSAQAIAENHGQQLGAITVCTRNLGSNVEFEVRDTGPGIPKDRQRRIFDMFYTTKPPGQGTGQGLAIILSSIRRHRGEIEVDSEPGQGARFIIRLPKIAQTGILSGHAA